MSEFKVTMSNGNKKIGQIPNVSLTPVKSCAKGVPCGIPKNGRKTGACYANKSYQMYPNVRKAWDGNYEYWRADPIAFENDLIELLSKKKKMPYFRWCVAGDLVDAAFLMMVVNVAKKFPDTRFLQFTKNYQLVNHYVYCLCDDDRNNLPKNLQIVFSAWPDFPMKNRYAFPVAWYVDEKEERDKRIPDGYPMHECPGSCVTCKFCWSPTKPIIFNAH